MGLFGKRKTEEVEPDFLEMGEKLIIFDNDKRTVDIVPVTAVTAEAVESTGRIIVPFADVEVFVDGYSRVFTYRAPSEIIEETKRIAQLEQSVVLQQLTQYKEKPLDNPNMDLRWWMLAVILLITIVITAF